MKIIFFISFVFLICTNCKKRLFEDSRTDQFEIENQKIELKQNPANKNPPHHSKTYSEFEKSLLVEVVPHQKAFIYEINFKWDPFEIPKKLRIREDKRVIETATNTGYFQYTTQHDQNIRFVFEILNDENLLEYTFTKNLSIPKDFVVSDGNRILFPTEITEKGNVYRYNRVFLNGEFSLIIDQAVNYVEINHLYTINKEVNIIENVDSKENPEYRALPEKNGKKGGSLFIVINNLYGRIKIINRGQSGGHGVNGAPFVSRAADGTPGEAGRMDFCDGPDIPHGTSKIFRGVQRCTCDSLGTPGGPGENGADGVSGTNGGDGGDSGDVSVKVNRVYQEENKEIIDSIYSEDLNFVQVELIKGSKGNKGLGSDGQLGGVGGAGAGGICSRNATKGSDGSKGKRGRDGFDGVDGSVGKKCVAIPVLGVNYCE